MIHAAYEALRAWNKDNDDRAKLQHAYVVVSIVVLVLAGLVSLVNYRLGQAVLFGAIVLILIAIANSVGWALLQSFVLNRLNRRPTTKK